MNDDEREHILKDFLDREFSSTDIFLFQEITKPEQFQQLLNTKIKCLAYDDRGRAHQYVLTCYNSDKVEPIISSQDLFDKDRAILVSQPKDRLRDVLAVPFKCKKTNHIVNTYNLHLKAGIDQAERRKEQTLMFVTELKNKNISTKESLVIGGDFNSYKRKIKNVEINEIDFFLELSKNNGFDFFTQKDKPTTLAFTQKTFDYLMINTEKTIKEYKVHPVCDKSPKAASQFEDFLFYKENISDHCPVTTVLEL